VGGVKVAVFLSLAAGALLCTGCATTRVDPDASARQALAPTGKLRVAVYPGSPTSMVKDAASGETRGVTWELGQALAARLGVPFEPVVFPRPAEVIEGLKAGKADVTFTNASPARAREVDFTPALLAIEQGFLVPAGSKLAKIEDVDRPGVRVGVSTGSTSEGLLTREAKYLTLLRAPTLKEAVDLLAAGRLDAFATNKAILSELSDQLPGSRILEGRIGLENMALGIPKGREAGMDYLRKFAEEVTADGSVQRAVKRAGVRGTTLEKGVKTQ
jgi:polar amino acid transport system substrate-binding protein